MAKKKRAGKKKRAKPTRAIKSVRARKVPVAAPKPPPTALASEVKPKEHVTITKAKGRPMLTWVGKRPLTAVTAFPAQHVESFTASDAAKVPLADPADSWLADWNRMRKQGDTPNKIEVIELRSDPKYGKFIAHKPASARVEIRRVKDKLVVEVKDFLSPTIIERLQDQAGPLLAPKIPDWRAMVDSVMIDPTYDGKVFKITLADVPEGKQDYVQGKYEIDAPPGETTVAVKVTDMLGEEVLLTVSA